MATATPKTTRSPKPAPTAVTKPAAKTPTAARTPAKRLTTKPVGKVVAKTAQPANAAKTPAAPKVKKEKKVKLNCSLPAGEYSMLASLKARSAKLGVAVKKSTVVRAALKALANLPDAALLAAVKSIPAKKPAKNTPNQAIQPT